MSSASRIQFALAIYFFIAAFTSISALAHQKNPRDEFEATATKAQTAAGAFELASKDLRNAVKMVRDAESNVKRAEEFVQKQKKAEWEALEKLATVFKKIPQDEKQIQSHRDDLIEKQEKLKAAELQLKETEAALNSADQKLNEVTKKVTNHVRKAVDVLDPPAAKGADPSQSPVNKKPTQLPAGKTATKTHGVSLQLPLIEKILPADKLSDFRTDPEREVRNFPPGDLIDEHFVEPAHFPLWDFDFQGQYRSSEGAIIYEGMRFELDGNGHYRVHFVVGTPAMPITLRLQFVLADAAGSNQRTVTLPPISIPRKKEPKHTAEQAATAPVYANIQSVYHEGYLRPSITRHGIPVTLTKVVSRKGTARFGFGVDVP